MKVLILGGDGYLGWPTAMNFSSKDHDVMVLDNYLRRDLCRKHDVESLILPPNLVERIRIWQEVSRKKIDARIGDCCDFNFLSSLFNEYQPEAVIHYAEQPSAPYSMLNHEAASLTLFNNLQATQNIAWAVHEHCPDCHIIKLGTMGVYGTPNIDIEEGWLDIEHKGRKDRFLYPRQASSLYHTTKIQDTDMLWFYVRTWGIRVTDLQQGPVYGIETDETLLDDRLRTIFNYDEMFGTILNRFVVQAVCGYPLTVYGKGGQTRGYINIRDTIRCVELAMLHPADAGQLNIFNQVTETFSVNELADKVASIGQSRGHNVEVKSIKNPRIEKEEHYYNPTYSGLQNLGLEPHLLTGSVLNTMFAVVEEYKENIQEHKIFRGVKW